MATHRSCGTVLYHRWEGINQRIYNPNSRAYKYYGGRGIKLCDDWRDFIKFRDWALSNGFDEKLTIDRIDGDGDYCPENCRWITGTENKKNVQPRRRNKKYNWGLTKVGGKFHVIIWKDNRNNFIGAFKTEDEAILKRDQFLDGEICSRHIRSDAGIYEKPYGFVVHHNVNKKTVHVGTGKTIEEARILKQNFIKNIQHEKR